MTEPTMLLGSLLHERYRLLEIIGRGGMATVLKAEDTKHRRQVAIKIFRNDVAQLGGPDRFAREIAILATLQHPNILPLLDSGMIDEQPYYVMPFIQGESLRERVSREGRLPVPDAVRLLVEVVDALRYAHELGIVHRDIKPENVLLSGRHALVADFGIARTQASGDLRHTTAGIAIGTPNYMAPEQAAGDPELDGRADIYAVGILAFELLTGQPPFAGKSAPAILAAHLTETAPPLDEVRLDVPRQLADTVARCLAKRAPDRPTAAALGEQLEHFLSPSGAITPVATGAVATTRRRNLWLALLFVAVAAVATYQWLAPRPLDVTVTGTRRLSVESGLELDPAPSPDGRLLAYAGGVNGSLRILVRQFDGGDPIAIAESVGGNQRAPEWSADGNRIWFQANGSIYRAPSLPGPVELMVEGTPEAPAADPAMAPGGARLAFTQGGEIRVRSLPDGATTTVTTDPDAHSLAWSPDGTRLAFVSGNRDFSWSETLLGNVAPSRIRLVEVADKSVVDLTDGRSLATSPRWLGDRAIVFVAGGGGFRDLFSQSISRGGTPVGAPIRLTTGVNAHSIRGTADGSGLMVATLEQSSNIWKAEIPARGVGSIRTASPVTEGRQVIEDLDVLPLSGWLAFDGNQEGNQDIYLQNLDSERPIQLTHDPGDEFGPTWSPNGKEIAYYSVVDGVRHVFVMRANGRDVRQVTSDSLGDHQPHWAPDGNHLVFYRRDRAGRDHPFTAERGADSTWARAVSLTDELGTATTWSADGRWIAFTNPAGEVRIFPVGGGEGRTVARPSDVGGDRLKRPQWLPFQPRILARVERPGGQGAIWELSLDGTLPREVLRLDDPDHPVFRDDFVTDGKNIFFTVTDQRSDLVVLDLSGVK